VIAGVIGDTVEDRAAGSTRGFHEQNNFGYFDHRLNSLSICGGMAAKKQMPRTGVAFAMTIKSDKYL
jgi:hypothetical protein